jgi:hypothetical protein
MAQTQDIAFHLGNTWDIECTVRDADDAPIEIQAAEWRVASNSAQKIKATVGAGITVTGPGRLSVKITTAMQSDIAAGRYRHELWVLDARSADSSVQIVGTLTLIDSLKSKYP